MQNASLPYADQLRERTQIRIQGLSLLETRFQALKYMRAAVTNAVILSPFEPAQPAFLFRDARPNANTEHQLCQQSIVTIKVSYRVLCQ